LTRRRMVAMSSANSDGTVYPTVSGILSVVAPASTTASRTWQRN
jgi:hypothetical protein